MHACSVVIDDYVYYAQADGGIAKRSPTNVSGKKNIGIEAMNKDYFNFLGTYLGCIRFFVARVIIY